MNERSYFRMQQTCREINEFIRTNRHISVNSNSIQEIGYNKEKSLWHLINRYKQEELIELSVIYGIRIGTLVLSGT